MITIQTQASRTQNWRTTFKLLDCKRLQHLTAKDCNKLLTSLQRNPCTTGPDEQLKAFKAQPWAPPFVRARLLARCHDCHYTCPLWSLSLSLSLSLSRTLTQTHCSRTLAFAGSLAFACSLARLLARLLACALSRFLSISFSRVLSLFLSVAKWYVSFHVTWRICDMTDMLVTWLSCVIDLTMTHAYLTHMWHDYHVRLT